MFKGGTVNMDRYEIDDNRSYRVVVNHEEQYSIWTTDRDLPRGWKEAGKQGSKQECLDFIKEVWVDMRPLSLRKAMDHQETMNNKT
jgi:MbtH protein